MCVKDTFRRVRFRIVFFSTLALTLESSAAAQAGGRSPESLARLAEARRHVRTFLAAVRKMSTVRTMKQWGKAHDELTRAERVFRKQLREIGEEGFEAFEEGVLRSLPQLKNRGEQWGPYVSAAAVDGGVGGIAHLNRFFQHPKLTMKMRVGILEMIPGTSLPADWIDEAPFLEIMKSVLQEKKQRGIAGAWVGDKSYSTPIRYCDRAVQLIATWYNPPDVRTLDLFKADDSARDEAVRAASAWVEARPHRLKAREKLFDILKDYRSLRLDASQMTMLANLWRGLEDRRTWPNLRDIERLVRAYLDELRQRKEAEGEPSVEERHFLNEMVRLLRDYFKQAGHHLRDPKGKERKHVEAAVDWLREESSEAAKKGYSWFKRHQWEQFAKRLPDLAQPARDDTKAR